MTASVGFSILGLGNSLTSIWPGFTKTAAFIKFLLVLSIYKYFSENFLKRRLPFFYSYMQKLHKKRPGANIPGHNSLGT
jgi:hypothetical protein